MFREHIRRVCEDAGHQVVGEAEDGIEGIRLAHHLRPEAILLDLVLPGISGFGVAEEMARARPRLRVIVISASVETFVVHRLDRVGISGFIDKSFETSGRLSEALSLVSQGNTYFSDSYLTTRFRVRTSPDSFTKVLSERECAVLSLIGQGQGDDEISAALGISATTAQTHRANILRKLSIRGTPKLIVFARKHGFATLLIGISILAFKGR